MIVGETLLSDTTSVLKQHVVHHSDKCIETDPISDEDKQAQTGDHKVERKASSSSAQLLEEMKYLQEENKALKEQVSSVFHRTINF